MKINEDIVSYENFSDYIKDKIQVSVGINNSPTFFVDVDNAVIVGHCLDEDADLLVAVFRDIADAIELETKAKSH